MQIPGLDTEFATINDIWQSADFDDSLMSWLQFYSPFLEDYVRRNAFMLIATLPPYRPAFQYVDYEKQYLQWKAEHTAPRINKAKKWDELTLRQQHLRIHAIAAAALGESTEDIAQVVYKLVTDAKNGDKTAVKILAPYLFGNTEQQQEQQKEAENILEF